VDSFKEKELCSEVAKGVKGIKAVRNNITVAYKSKRPDSEIKPEIERLLDSDVRIDDLLIDVAVKDGKVALSGRVGSAAEKSAARWTSWVAGVKGVDVSGLHVNWRARDEMQRKRRYISKSDEEIEQAVKDALEHDPRVWSFRVDAESDGGVVELSGIVDNLKAKKAAEEDARNTVGVWSVRNHLKVRPERDISDFDLTRSVALALERDPYVDRHDLSVSCYNGKVHLHGAVDSAFEKEQAEDVARRVNGVVDVRNSLVVTAERPRKSDWEIERNIADQLFWSPLVDRNDVTVSVEGGIATLTGAVDSWQEYRAATENAYEGGAHTVLNRLRVM
jgi:osmotically-inducible protein OsmY